MNRLRLEMHSISKDKVVGQSPELKKYAKDINKNLREGIRKKIVLDFTNVDSISLKEFEVLLEEPVRELRWLNVFSRITIANANDEILHNYQLCKNKLGNI